MHIVIVNRGYPPASQPGGIATYNYYLCRALVQSGHKVTVVAARWSSETPELDMDRGVVIHRVLNRQRWWFRRLPIVGRYMRVLCQLIYSFQVAAKVRKIEREDRPDVIEIADVEAEGFAYLLRKRRCLTVVRCHTPMFVLRRYYRREEMPFDTSLISRLEKFCIRHADAVSAPSRDMAATIADECGVSPDQITVIPNPVEMESLDSALPEADAGKNPPNAVRPRDPLTNEFTVLHVGRLERAKGIEVLARAAPLVLARVPNARFVFIGGAADIPFWQQRLESLLEAHGNSGKITLAGAVDADCLAHWYRRADVAVVASQLYESFSYTCAQAMACGVPVVASRIGGIPETLDHGRCGVLVDPGDSRELARAIIHLAENPRLRQAMGQAGRTRAAAVFASPRVASETVTLYASLRGRRDQGKAGALSAMLGLQTKEDPLDP